eukprot:scaffold25099_cov90-Isochrysis_galbana.AAC.1
MTDTRVSGGGGEAGKRKQSTVRSGLSLVRSGLSVVQIWVEPGTIRVRSGLSVVQIWVEPGTIRVRSGLSVVQIWVEPGTIRVELCGRHAWRVSRMGIVAAPGVKHSRVSEATACFPRAAHGLDQFRHPRTDAPFTAGFTAPRACGGDGRHRLHQRIRLAIRARSVLVAKEATVRDPISRRTQTGAPVPGLAGSASVATVCSVAAAGDSPGKGARRASAALVQTADDRHPTRQPESAAPDRPQRVEKGSR